MMVMQTSMSDDEDDDGNDDVNANQSINVYSSEQPSLIFQ